MLLWRVDDTTCQIDDLLCDGRVYIKTTLTRPTTVPPLVTEVG